MFTVSDQDAAAIRAAFHDEGELSAIIEIRRRYPGVGDRDQARECVRTIAGWEPLPGPSATVTQLVPRKRG